MKYVYRRTHSYLYEFLTLTFHSSLKSIDRVNFSNKYSRSKCSQALSTSFSNISITSNKAHLQMYTRTLYIIHTTFLMQAKATKTPGPAIMPVIQNQEVNQRPRSNARNSCCFLLPALFRHPFTSRIPDKDQQKENSSSFFLLKPIKVQHNIPTYSSYSRFTFSSAGDLW